MGARKSDPHTSHAAAVSVNTRYLEQRVYDALLMCGSLTAEEVAKYVKIDKQSITPRFRPMANRGLIKETGMYRDNVSGRKAIVWRAIIQPKAKSAK